MNNFIVLRPVLNSQKFNANIIDGNLIEEIIKLPLFQYSDINFENEVELIQIEQKVNNEIKSENIIFHFDLTASLKRAYHNRLFMINENKIPFFGTVVITGKFDYLTNSYLGLKDNVLKYLMELFKYPQNIYFINDCIQSVVIDKQEHFCKSIPVIGTQNVIFEKMLKYTELRNYLLFGEIGENAFAEITEKTGNFKIRTKVDPLIELIESKERFKQVNDQKTNIFDDLFKKV